MENNVNLEGALIRASSIFLLLGPGPFRSFERATSSKGLALEGEFLGKIP